MKRKRRRRRRGMADRSEPSNYGNVGVLHTPQISGTEASSHAGYHLGEEVKLLQVIKTTYSKPHRHSKKYLWNDSVILNQWTDSGHFFFFFFCLWTQTDKLIEIVFVVKLLCLTVMIYEISRDKNEIWIVLPSNKREKIRLEMKRKVFAVVYS